MTGLIVTNLAKAGRSSSNRWGMDRPAGQIVSVVDAQPSDRVVISSPEGWAGR